MRFNAETLKHVQNRIGQNFVPPSVDAHRPFVAVYVRRSDKVQGREMKKAYSLEEYFQLFETDSRKLNISTIYLNSEDPAAFDEFKTFSPERTNFYKLITIKVTREMNFMKMIALGPEGRRNIVLEFLTDLFIEVNADLHVGTLTSNWCRLVDEIRLTLGKIMPFYTPENRFIIDV